MSKWDGGYEEGRSRVYIAVSSACHDRERFDHWFFNNIGGSCNQKQCIQYPGGCLLSEEGLGCSPCIEKGRPCSWKDGYIIAVIAGELELSYGKAFEFFTKLLKDSIFRDQLRGEYSRDPDPNDELHPVKIQARLHSAERELQEAQDEIGRRDARLKRLIEDLKETRQRLTDTRRELAAYARRNPPRAAPPPQATPAEPSSPDTPRQMHRPFQGIPLVRYRRAVNREPSSSPSE